MIRSTRINPGLDWFDRWPISVGCPARKVEPDLVFFGGLIPLDPGGEMIGVGNVQEQARYVFSKMKECVEAAGGTVDDIIEVQTFHKDVRQIPRVLEVGKEFFSRSKPTWSAVGTSGLYNAKADISVSGLAVLNAKTRDINPGLNWYNKAPWDVAVPCKVANDLLVIGQMSGIDEQGNVVGSGDMAAQTSYTLRKIKECVEQAGGTTDNLMDFLGYTTDQRNQIYQLTALDDFVVKDPRSGPKRSEHLACTTITMPGLWHPDILGQMHIYGVLGNKTQVNLGEWVTWHDFYPVDMAPYAVKVGRYVFVSGAVMFDQLFNEPTLEEDFPSIRKQARWAFQEYQRFLKTIGANMDNVVFIQPYAPVQFQEPIMEVAREFFHNEQPVWNPVGHRGLFLPNHLCEIYGMAIVDETLP